MKPDNNFRNTHEKATQWTLGENAYGGFSIYEGREERYSDVQKLDSSFTHDELAAIVKQHNEYEALNAVAEAAADADCGCTVRERDSGHRTGCVMEHLHEALTKLATIRAKG